MPNHSLRAFSRRLLTGLVLASPLLLAACRKPPENASLLNVSYDPTRELYTEYNDAFAKHWLKETSQVVTVKQSHGGSGKQARAVIDGLEADVVTLAIEQDVTAISKSGLITKDWKQRLPENSAPYTSVIVLVVRAGNPKNIRDWNDLAREGVSVITPNPKTGGGARLNYLAAWAYGLKAFGGDEAQVRDFVGKIYKNVAVLDTGARGSTTTFVERGIGDVLISWENEAQMTFQTFGASRFEVVIPSITISAEPSVTVVDKVAAKHKTTELAQAYLKYLYSPEGQAIIAKHHFRPRDKQLLERDAQRFAKVPLVTVADLGGWETVQTKHFVDGALFDQIYKPPAAAAK